MRRNTKKPGRRPSSRPFITAVSLLSLLSAYSFLAHTYLSGYDDTHATPGLLTARSEQHQPTCDQVHKAQDQCAFIKEYCSDNQSGLIPYLSLYYCTLGEAKVFGFVLLISWLGLLFTTIGIAASDFFSVNLGTISSILGLSESLAGVTFLAFGNGSPDVFSTFAAMNSNSASMAVGELIGAASFISAVVAGSMALVREFQVDKKTYVRDIFFFIVAVAFTMVFLADGHLHLWECCAMVAYYAVYVATVVGQHWIGTRRKKRQRREGEARSHFYGSVGASMDELAGEPYRDDPDDEQAQHHSAEISALEQGPRIEVEGQSIPLEDDQNDETEEDHERMVAAEVASSMRVLRTGGRRRNTLNPIRPSLVGALEFRSALAQLQRESNHKMSPLATHGRSFSADHLQAAISPTPTTPAQLTADQHSPHTISVLKNPSDGRTRAHSSGSAPNQLIAGPELAVQSPSPISAEHPRADGGRRSPSPSPSTSHIVGGNLAPPPANASLSPLNNPLRSEAGIPSLHLQIPSRRSSHSVGSSPTSPFPMYTDSPAVLTPLPQLGEQNFMLPTPLQREMPFADVQMVVQHPKPVKWWPYSVLPPPHVMYAALFPTLQGWSEKTFWDKFASTISMPSIFFLAITLPVVESDASDEDGSFVGTALHDPAYPHTSGHSILSLSEADETETEWQRYQRHSMSRRNSYQGRQLHLSLENESTLVADENGRAVAGARPLTPADGKPGSGTASMDHANDETLSWNRWLVCIQLFTGPLFAVFVIWTGMRDDLDSPGRTFAKMAMYSLLVSLVLLAFLVVFTSENVKPKYHYFLCFLGFAISIAWISTIAEEVVGVLKTFGIMLNISEALLGLTIFAAGNSVGDLVADITIARLGYPVMALCACFGGPMLNILLGIGIGGLLMMVRGANKSHKKFPDRPLKYGPYPIRVGGTLMLSAATLIVVLVGLVIAVPMNKWILSRRIGWALISIWTVSTVVNVIIELTGVWDEVA
ncbi:solute carrier family 24 (sodium/potassium/calcium exchanger), member 6 [Geosmithia morbida]|uniref:Solute carrier family 24 (Sodium/potassium/calcium exchanger), member 6 n=1 Tax=Geosmithia morbida TaxID=1094350 RepID=A0A9P4YVH0_9HYPO|nr:solute carrier family 24 (sodium/potassium/calcium exchanger), member 6 [Geosmithia morbida]KAF4123585.1 solute carrier family 24 (sodium/potassium/calcium exchanger), member 6 [Geosmithia morbida]